MEKLFSWVKNNIILVGILIVAFLLRIYGLDFQSVWLDEIHTINEANPNFSLSQLHQALLGSDPHPPLYFVLVQLFFKLFGYSEFVLRLFSVFVGIGGIVAIYYLGKEFINKNVGIIVALFTTVNYFHLYYSQEGRMYAFMFFTTVLSFLFLVRFLKKPNTKTSVLYGVFTVLMIYSHFFALFALASQCFILLYFLIFPPDQIKRLQFFKLSALAGILIGVLYIPSVELLIQTAQRDSFWIPKPEKDVYIQIFKDFFGRSDVLYYLMTILIILFLVSVFLEFRNSKKEQIKPIENKYVFTFFILFVWIFITLLIPWIRSQISLPMIIDRYFINVLPAVLIAVSVGVNFIKNKYVKTIIVIFIVLFSLNHIINKRDYYSRINKSQFREVSLFISENNQNNDNVVSQLRWYLPFFLPNENVIHNDLETYISEMKNSEKEIHSFWYFDAHNNLYNPSEETKKYLEENFVVDKEIELFDCWTKHFIPKTNYRLYKISLEDFLPLEENQGNKTNYNVEVLEFNDKNVIVKGWTYLEEIDSKDTVIEVVAIEKTGAFVLPHKKIIRQDVTEYFKSKNNLDYSGFEVSIDKSLLPKENYILGLILRNNEYNKKGLIVTDKTFSVE